MVGERHTCGQDLAEFWIGDERFLEIGALSLKLASGTRVPSVLEELISSIEIILVMLLSLCLGLIGARPHGWGAGGHDVVWCGGCSIEALSRRMEEIKVLGQVMKLVASSLQNMVGRG